MKIKAIDIAAFGKFKNFHLDLSDGLSVIYGQNEKGKSTLMAFVRMMFYGNTGKASGIDKNPRKKYRPWDTDLMAGSITFEHEGINYRLEREFKASNSTDKISLINLDLNEKQTLSGSEDIGAKFFGLTDGAFERSVFISEPTFAAKNDAADGEINAKLSNIATTSDDDVSFEKVYLRLRTAKEALLSKSRKIGKLDKAYFELETLEARLKEAKENEEKVLSLKAAATLKEEEIAASSKAASTLFDRLKNSDKIKKKNFISRYIETEKERARAKEMLALKDGGFAEKFYIDSLKALADEISALGEEQEEVLADKSAKISEINVLKAELSAVSPKADNEIRTLVEKRDNIDKEIDSLRARNDELKAEMDAIKPTRKNNSALIIIGIILTVLSIIGFFMLTDQLVKMVCLGAVIVGQIIFVLGFVLKRKIMPDTTELSAKISENSARLDAKLQEKETALEEISKLKAQNSELEILAASKTALIKSKSDDIVSLENELGGLQSDLDNAKEKLAAQMSNLKHGEQADVSETIKNLENALGYYEMISQKITVLADHANCSSLEEAEAKLEAYKKDGSLADLTDEEIDSLKEQFKAQTDNTGTLRSQLTAINEQIKAATLGTEPVAVLERERDELKDKIKSYAEFTEVADLATASLDEAFRDLRKNYSEVLDQRTAEIFTKLSSDKYLSVSVSKSMEPAITTKEAFGTKEADYLSRGTEEQLYLALRLAIAELITNEGEKLPIFADDPFSFYDDERLLRAVAFLKDYARDKQIVMFTCHNFVKNVADKLDIKTLDM
ncbi:MAG: AAA family ATPase [Clostridia bacterium]|nr:AAA family ATPase [Clostridia bacterium]